MSITFTYPENYDPLSDSLYIDIIGDDVNYSETGTGSTPNLDFAGKGTSSGGTTNMFHAALTS